MAVEISGLVGDLGDLADVQPLSAVGTEPSALRSGPAGARATARQSVPARDRAVMHRHGDEMFQMSRVAMPWLVADLEPRVVTAARPMSGRSVGARPVGARPNPPLDSVPPNTVPSRDASRW